MSADTIVSATGARTIRMVANPAQHKAGPNPPRKVRHDPHPVLVIFAACTASFSISVFLTGLLAAWVYYWRN